MTRQSFLFLLSFLLLAGTAPGQIVVLDSFNPDETTDLCGIGFDHETGNVWVYACFGDSLYGYRPPVNALVRWPGRENPRTMSTSPLRRMRSISMGR